MPFPLTPSVQIFLYRTDLFHDAKLCRAYYERFHENLVVPTTYEQYLHAAEFFTRSCNPDSPTEYGTTMTCGSASVAAKRFSALLPFPHRPLRLHAGDPPLGLPRNAGGHAPVPCTGKVLLQAELVGRQHPEICGGKDRHDRHLLQLCSRTDQLRKFGGRRSGGRGHPSGMPKPLLGGGIVGISRYSQKAEACKQFFHWYYSADVASLLVVWVAPPPLWMPMRISRTTASSRG